MAHPDNPAWRRNTTLTPRQRFARGGIFYERVINVVAKITTVVLIAAGIGLASGVIPHAWCYAGDHANGFWILAAILFLL